MEREILLERLEDLLIELNKTKILAQNNDNYYHSLMRACEKLGIIAIEVKR